MNSTFQSEWRPMADIPNQEGFLLTVEMENGMQLKTIVMKRADGTHGLVLPNGNDDYKKCRVWKPRQKTWLGTETI
jgi:hypothetical protein